MTHLTWVSPNRGRQDICESYPPACSARYGQQPQLQCRDAHTSRTFCLVPRVEAEVGEEEAPIIRYVHMVISEALKRRASDIHMEPLEKRFRVRYRIDGVLHEVENPPKRLQPSVQIKTASFTKKRWTSMIL